MNIYITHLPLSITQREIKELFLPFGSVKGVRIGLDKHTGLPDGTAHVYMQSAQEALDAIASLDGSELNGVKIRVMQEEGADFPSDEYWG